MPTIFSHALAGAALGTVFQPPVWPLRYWLAGALCSVIPDADVVAFWFGVPWGHVLGHRGITHSLPFAVALAAAVVGSAFRGRAWDGRRGTVGLFLFLATASHGVLDAMTDGGPGVAFFAPVDDTRYFLPWQPIPVSPISLGRFFSERGRRVLEAEAIWIGLPAAVLVAAGAVLRARRRGRR
jgi:inner membrane protein